MRALVLGVFLLLCGCNPGCNQKSRCDCNTGRTECLDVCKDHVAVPTQVNLGENQNGKVACLRACFEIYDACMVEVNK